MDKSSGQVINISNSKQKIKKNDCTFLISLELAEISLHHDPKNKC